MTDILQALATAIAANVPVLLWGGPGTGKTSAISSLAAASDLPLEIVIAAIREPTDFAGLPIVSDTGVRLAAPDWAVRLREHGRGLLFLDEISTAPPAVQAALLRVVLERHVGDVALPDDVVVVAAANPPDQAADGWDLAAPLANRFCHLDWPVDVDGWVTGMLEGFALQALPALDPTRLDAARRAARSDIAAYVRTRPSRLYAPPDDPVLAGRAWASPRTWTMASELVAAADAAGASAAVRALLLAGAVGPAHAGEFLAWREADDLPDPETVLADPHGLVLPERSDRVYAVLAGVAAAVLADNTPARWEAAWQAVARANGTGHADIAVAIVRTLVRHRPEGARPPQEVLRDMAPVLREAGLFDRLQG